VCLYHGGKTKEPHGVDAKVARTEGRDSHGDILTSLSMMEGSGRK
jgi:hypothetical protein